MPIELRILGGARAGQAETFDIDPLGKRRVLEVP